MALGLVAQSDLAAKLGVSRQELWRWRKLGAPGFELAGEVRYEEDKLCAWLRANYKRLPKKIQQILVDQGILPVDDLPSASQPNVSVGGETPEEIVKAVVDTEKLKQYHLEARVRKERALASRHEQNLALQRAALVPVEEVRQQNLRKLAVVRAGLLSLPGKLAGRIAHRDVREVHQELDKGVRELLALFASGVDLASGADEYLEQERTVPVINPETGESVALDAHVPSAQVDPEGAHAGRDQA